MTATLNGAKIAPLSLATLPADVDVDRKPSRLVSVGDRALRHVRADFRVWWLRTVNPPSLTDWRAARTPRRIPADDSRLRVAWHVDHWTTGLLLAGLSISLFLLAAGVRWMACHPARRWAALLLTFATAVVWLA